MDVLACHDRTGTGLRPTAVSGLNRQPLDLIDTDKHGLERNLRGSVISGPDVRAGGLVVVVTGVAEEQVAEIGSDTPS